MKQTTKQILGIAAASAVLAGAAGGVLAQGGYGPGWGGPGGMMGPNTMRGPGHMMGGPGGMPGMLGGPGAMMSADPVAYTEQQLARTKTELGITAEQESAWKAYADAATAKAGLMASHRQAMFGATPVTPEQRLAFHQQGLAEMQQLTAATRALYAVLTPEQRSKTGSLLGPCTATW